MEPAATAMPPRRSGLRHLGSSLLVLAVVAAGCGSTVQGEGPILAGAADGAVPPAEAGAQVGGDGLAAPPPAGGVGAAGTPGVPSSGSATGRPPTTSGGAATGTTAGGGASTSTGPAAPAGGTAPAPAEPAPAGDAAAAPPAAAPPAAGAPVSVGIVITQTSNADDFGVSLGNTVAERDVDDAVVAALNAQGGIAGRQIVPVYAETDTGSPSWDTDFAEACATFTQDNQVEVVAGYVFGHFDTLEGCLADAGVPHLSTTFASPDRATFSEYGRLVNLSTPSFERRSIGKVEGALATGLLTADSRLGIVYEDCGPELRAYEGTVRPAIEGLGVTIADEFALRCARSAADGAGAAAQIGNILLRFRANDVDTITFMSRSEGPAVLLVSLQAESQAYRPAYLVSSLAQTAIIGPQMPEEQRKNVHGFGWLPAQDVNPADAPPATAAAQRCNDLVASQGVVLTAPADYAYAHNICDALFLYERALTATGGNSDGAAVIAAIDALGPAFQSAQVLDGRTSFGPGRHDGPVDYRQLDYDTGCACFRYGAHTGSFPG